MRKTLAICIPTYNRPKYLLEFLKTAVGWLNGMNKNDVQICVSDNASEESYECVVEYMKSVDVEFIYSRTDKNYGADANFLRAVEIADADYCWLAGDDDGIAEGAIDVVLSYVKTNPDISVFWGNRIICNKKLKPFMKDKWTKERQSFIVDFSNEDKVVEYFDKLNSTTSMGYLTSLIVKKEEWDTQRTYCEKYKGTIYVQVAQYLSMLKGKGKMMCIRECIALSRFGNDGFYENFKQRIFMDYKGFLAITGVFEDSPMIAEALKRILRRHYNGIFLAAMAYMNKPDEEEKQMMYMLGYTEKDMRIFGYKSKIVILFKLGARIIKSMFCDFSWFIKTSFITLQKV
ncbi:Abequosyltransferase RfbV [Eubacterium plexicaudatum ASF492]|uniref:Glycosyltransferase 2-like domain-containing protein n=1 Tax=Eubacterium plexicaudatum ASF492 TaxID=1235802 RepID=N2AJF1_9FIRM|nr:Abequosyltransferase RfbV [Eubacterium plexicaudatum ASF492]